MQYSDDVIYWLALRHIPGLGPAAIRRKWIEVQDIRCVWEEFSLNLPQANSLLDAASLELEQAKGYNVDILTLNHTTYPPQLLAIPTAPSVLYVLGQLQPQDQRSAGIVGTRHPSPYGIDATQRLTQQLVGLNYTIISGMAKGIDAVAHRTAVESGGRTIAVWGSGLDCVYPPQHKALAEKILQHGAIVSQFPLGTKAQSFTFPERNKVIAGLSQVIIVTEAQAKSGSLLTAEAGLKYGRRVGAIPGSIHHIGSAGPHQLIKNGARLVVDAADIVDTMVATNANLHAIHPPTTPVTASEQTVLNQLQSGPQHIDAIIRSATQPAAEIVSTLAMLEIKGLVKQLAPGEYLATVKPNEM